MDIIEKTTKDSMVAGRERESAKELGNDCWLNLALVLSKSVDATNNRLMIAQERLRQYSGNKMLQADHKAAHSYQLIVCLDYCCHYSVVVV